MNIENLDVCPECLGKLKHGVDSSVCQKCGSSFHKGDEITLTLGQLMRLKTANETEKKTKKRKKRLHEEYYIKKKKIPHKTGFFGVTRIKRKKKNHSPAWRYINVPSRINIQSVSLLTLKKKVEDAGGRWGVVYRPSALKSAELEGVSLKELE